MHTKPPDWEVPSNIAEIVAEEEMWEDDRWSPILLTVLGGTIYRGRDIPLSWQIEFEPSDAAFEVANAKVEARGVEPDGYGWANVINSVVGRHHPELAPELHFGDTDEDACVVWVESESSCRLLLEIVWTLIHDSK